MVEGDPPSLRTAYSCLLHTAYFGLEYCRGTGRTILAKLKVLEHRKLGWKVLILKNDLGKSLSNEM